MSKPALPSRDRGVQAIQPKLPPRSSSVQTKFTHQPTEPIRPISSKPILPARVPLSQNGPALPSRTHTVVQENNQRTCGRQKRAKYEERDFEVVDSYVRSLPEYNSVSETSYALTCNFPDVVDKYRAIFDWIAYNIAYDADSFLRNRVPPQSAQNTFKTKSAVCAGYSQLFQALCENSQLHCIEVSGYGKGFGFSPDQPLVKGSNHAWNAVRVHDEWRMVDATWGAGSLNGTTFSFAFNPFFFLADPEEFIYQHMPTDDTKQFTATKFSWEQFFAMNNMTGQVFTSGIQMLNHIDCGSVLRPVQGQEIDLQLLVPKTISLILGFDINGHDAPRFLLLEESTRAGYDKAVCTFRVNSIGASTLTIFWKEKSQPAEAVFGSLLTMHVVITPHPSGKIVALPAFPVTYGHESCSLVSPLVSPLQARTTHHFIFKDLAADAPSQNRDLLLWQDQPGSALRKKVTNGRVTYEVTQHLATSGEISVRERRGNAFYPLAIWQI